MMTGYIKAGLVGLALLAAVGQARYFYNMGFDKSDREATVRAQALALAQAEAFQHELAEVQNINAGLVEGLVKTEQEAANELQNRDRTIDRLNQRLLQRAARPSELAGQHNGQAATAEGSAASCTGRELYREDGEFLVGEAARADELRVRLGVCQVHYAEAMKANEKFGEFLANLRKDLATSGKN